MQKSKYQKCCAVGPTKPFLSRRKKESRQMESSVAISVDAADLTKSNPVFSPRSQPVVRGVHRRGSGAGLRCRWTGYYRPQLLQMMGFEGRNCKWPVRACASLIIVPHFPIRQTKTYHTGQFVIAGTSRFAVKLWQISRVQKTARCQTVSCTVF